MFGLSPVELCLIGAVAVMLYGKRLPEVGRSVGEGITELRRHWTTLSKDLDVSSHLEGRGGRPRPRAGRDGEDRVEAGHLASPKFDPPADADHAG
jgi:sec-independent protein translocase protein TatA